MLKFIKDLLFRNKKKAEPTRQTEAERNNVTSSDFIDYDGMGNQGRFPSTKKK